MFDASCGGWDDVPAALLSTYLPPGDEPREWDAPDYDDWIDTLAAADRDRTPSQAEVVAAGETAPVDPAMVGALAAVDLDALDDNELIGFIRGITRTVNHLTALRLAAIARFAGPAPTGPLAPGAFAWQEIAAALHLGDGAGHKTVNLARRLHDDLPGTCGAMLAGDLDEYKAQLVADATVGLTADQCSQVEAAVLPTAATRTSTRLRRDLDRAVAGIDPDAHARRRRHAATTIRLVRRHCGDGMGELFAALPSEQLDSIYTAADTWARAAKAAGDPRTLDQLRVAALLDWANRYLTGRPTGDEPARDAAAASASTPTPTRHGLPVTVNIVLNLPAALGLTDDPATILDSGATIPAETVRDLLRDGARIRWLLIDPTTGQLTGTSTRAHDPPPLMRAFLHLRDATATTPTSSTAPANAQDHDHIDPRGPTDPANLHTPTRAWHRGKTFGHWRISANPDGTWTWTSQRTHRTYTTRPHDYRRHLPT